MPIKRIICLANSRRQGQRCVAGIDTETLEWIRMVNNGGGELSRDDIQCSDGTFPKVLDIIDVPTIKPQPLPHHPENWVIDRGRRWRKVGRFSKRNLCELCSDTDFIFRNNSDCLSGRNIQQNPLTSSLMLINLNRIVFAKTRNDYNRLQIRAKFNFNNQPYDLVVTDDKWEEIFRDHREYRKYRDSILLGITTLQLVWGLIFAAFIIN